VNEYEVSVGWIMIRDVVVSWQSSWCLCARARADVRRSVPPMPLTTMARHGSAEAAPVIGRLVGAVVEHLQKLRAAQMEHELRVDGELRAQLERPGIVLAVLGKLLALALAPRTHRS
jgi:hypothetical protein